MHGFIQGYSEPLIIDPACVERAHAFLGADEFRVWQALAETKLEIAGRLAPHARLVKPRWINGIEGQVTEGYGASLFNYMQIVRDERRFFAPVLRRLGDEISSLGRGPDWHRQEPLVQLRQEFIHVVQELRHDPAKGPGLAFFNPDGGLISYAAGSLWRKELPFPAEMQIGMLEAHTRRTMAICGERDSIARLTKTTYPDPDPFLHHRMAKQLTPLQIAKAYMIAYSKDICAAAPRATMLNGSTLHISIRVCGSCLPAVVDAGIARIFTDSDERSNGIRHIRMRSMERMQEKMPDRIEHHTLVRQAPIKLIRGCDAGAAPG